MNKIIHIFYVKKYNNTYYTYIEKERENSFIKSSKSAYVLNLQEDVVVLNNISFPQDIQYYVLSLLETIPDTVIFVFLPFECSATLMSQTIIDLQPLKHDGFLQVFLVHKPYGRRVQFWFDAIHKKWERTTLPSEEILGVYSREYIKSSTLKTIRDKLLRQKRPFLN